MTVTRVRLTSSVLTMPFASQTIIAPPQATSTRKLSTASSISKAMSNFRAIQTGTGGGAPIPKLEGPAMNANPNDVTVETLTVNMTLIHEAPKRNRWN